MIVLEGRVDLRRLPIFFLFLLIQTPWMLEADEEDLSRPPRFSHIGNKDEDSVLSAECEGKPPYTKIQCKFQQVSLRSNSPADVQKEYDQIKANFKNDEKEKKAMMDSMCDGSENQFAELEKVVSEDRKRQLLETVLEVREACKCKRSVLSGLMGKGDCVNKIFDLMASFKTRTCKIFTNSFDLDFKKIGNGKWVSNPGPRGICNHVTVVTLEKGKDDFDWSFTQVRTAVGSKSELCKDFELNKPAVYSSKFLSSVRRKCEFYEFGGW